jgi:hypothetical protein
MTRVKFKLHAATFLDLPTRQKDQARATAYKVFAATGGRPWADPPRDGFVRLYTHDMDDEATRSAESILDIRVPVDAVEQVAA